MINKTHFLIIFCLLIIGGFACHTKPKNNTQILPLDSVAVLVADCYFLESEIHIKQRTYDLKDYATLKYNDFFERNNITKEELVENVRYYFTNDKYAEIIMNKVDTIVERKIKVLRDSLNVNE